MNELLIWARLKLCQSLATELKEQVRQCLHIGQFFHVRDTVKTRFADNCVTKECTNDWRHLLCDQLVNLNVAFEADLSHHEQVIVALSDGAPLQLFLCTIWFLLALLRFVVCHRNESVRRLRALASTLLAASLLLSVPLIKHALLPWLIGQNGTQSVIDGVNQASVGVSSLATLPIGFRNSMQQSFALIETSISPFIINTTALALISQLKENSVFLNEESSRRLASLVCATTTTSEQTIETPSQDALLCAMLQSSHAFVQAMHEFSVLIIKSLSNELQEQSLRTQTLALQYALSQKAIVENEHELYLAIENLTKNRQTIKKVSLSIAMLFLFTFLVVICTSFFRLRSSQKNKKRKLN